MEAEDYDDEDAVEDHFTEEDIKLFEERTAKRVSGERKTYTWKDAGFVAEMARRVAELESGEAKGYTWSEVVKRARNSMEP